MCRFTYFYLMSKPSDKATVLGRSFKAETKIRFHGDSLLTATLIDPGTWTCGHKTENVRDFATIFRPEGNEIFGLDEPSRYSLYIN